MPSISNNPEVPAAASHEKEHTPGDPSPAWRRRWISIVIILVGVALMLFSKSLEWRIEQLWPHHGEWIAYFAEHLGAVVVVGMLIRVALEEGYERAFLGSVTEEVKQQVRASIDETSQKSLEPLTKELVNARNSIFQLDKDLNQLAKGLTYTIIQNLDDNLRKVLEEKVLNSTFVRSEYVLEITLRPFVTAGVAPASTLEVSITTRYKVKNRSDKSATYKVVSWLDDLIRPTGIRASEYTRFTFGRVDEKGEVHLYPDFSIPGLEHKKYIFEGNGLLNLQYEIADIGKDTTYLVIAEGKQLMRYHDVFVWNVVTLTDSVELTIELANGLTRADLNIRPGVMHHAQDQVSIDETNPTKTTMMLHQVFLPYQGVEVRWSPPPAVKSSSGGPPPPAAPSAPEATTQPPEYSG